MALIRNTRTARIEKRENGVVVTRILPHVLQTIQDAIENVMVSAEAGGGGKGPLLVDLREACPLDAETRHYYSGKQLTNHFTSLAMLVPIGAWGKMFGNIYLRVAKPGIPARLFTTEAEALAWSAGFLPGLNRQ
ncbi:MAG: hypothetical protein HY074_07140 [Deltaproteobacteria bacterium]|nr:hypothetical protein [Deltaproteobacteria bacterium]